MAREWIGWFGMWVLGWLCGVAAVAGTLDQPYPFTFIYWMMWLYLTKMVPIAAVLSIGAGIDIYYHDTQCLLISQWVFRFWWDIGAELMEMLGY